MILELERENQFGNVGGYIMLEIGKIDLFLSSGISQPHKKAMFLPSRSSLCQSFRTNQFISFCHWSLVLNSTIFDEIS